EELLGVAPAQIGDRHVVLALGDVFAGIRGDAGTPLAYRDGVLADGEGLDGDVMDRAFRGIVVAAHRQRAGGQRRHLGLGEGFAARRGGWYRGSRRRRRQFGRRGSLRRRMTGDLLRRRREERPPAEEVERGDADDAAGDEGADDDKATAPPRPPHRARVGQNAIDADRIGDVLDPLIAERLVAADQLVLDLLVDAAGDIDGARLGEALQPRRDVDAVAEDVVGLDDHVAEIDPDAIEDPLRVRQGRVAPDHALLDDDGAAHGLDRAVEHREEAVAGVLDDPAVMLDDGRIDQLAPLP